MKIPVLLLIITLLVACAEAPESDAVAENIATPEPTVKAQYYGDEGLGIRQQTLFSEDGVEPPTAVFPSDPPGTSQVLARAYLDAPPQIPHATTGLVPITKDMNACTGCHMPAVAMAINATAIPPSHFKEETLSNARHNCTQCHVPQANVAVLVENEFSP